MRARRALVGAALLASSCSGRGEVIPNPSPAPGSPATTEEISTTVLAAAPTTEAPTTTTTEPEPTTTAYVAPSTTRYLRPIATTVVEVSTEWVIPTYIVMCESKGNWNAYNPSSGASGPYQLMALHFDGELAMNQSRSAQHAKAAQLWNGGKGRHHWAECL